MELTQEQLDNMIAEEKQKWIDEEFNPLKTEVEELRKLKPVEKTDAEKEIEAKQAELWEKEKIITLKENEVQDFAEFFNCNNVKELQTKIEKLKTVLDTRAKANSFVPGEHRQTNDYSKAEANKDVFGMIGSKLSNLFNN